MTKEQLWQRGEMLEKRFGVMWVHRAILKLLRRGMRPARIGRLLGRWPSGIAGLARRHGIPISAPDVICIYVLRCPLSGDVKYVGQTEDPFSRLAQHIRKPMNRGMKQWILSLAQAELIPRLEVVARVKFKYRDRAEKAIIDKWRRRVSIFNSLRECHGEA